MRYLIQFSLLAALIAQATGDNLLLVQAIWRHGDRSPTTTFPTDANQVYNWTQGWGQLTTLGMQQHYALGSRLRGMYGDFINSSYRAEEIYVRSTDIDRTLMSAMSNLAGFYQNGVLGVDFPSATDVPGWPTSWSPVPVHTVDYDTDLIGYPLATCPRADQLYEQIQQGPNYLNITAQNQALFDWLTNVTGVTEPVTLDNLWLINDALSIEQIHNMPMPSWYNDTIYQQITTANDYADDFLFGIREPRVPELIKLRGGSLLKAVTDRMTAKADCMLNASSNSYCKSLNKLKYYVYSAHDVTVAALLATFGDKEEVVGGGLPHYAAAITLELWNISNVAQVKIMYHPEFNHTFFPITNLTKGCNETSDYCALDTFVSRSQDFIPQNITAECQRQNIAMTTAATDTTATTTTTPTTTTTTTTTTTPTTTATTAAPRTTSTATTAATNTANITNTTVAPNTTTTTTTAAPSSATSFKRLPTYSGHIIYSVIALLCGTIIRNGHFS